MLAGNTRDEGKLFPTLLPLVGGAGSGRLLNDATVFSTAFNYNPNARAAVDARAVDPAGVPADDDAGHRLQRRRRQLNRIFFLNSRDSMLTALKTQQSNIWYYRFDWDELPAPFNEIYGAAHAFDLPFAFGNFGPSLYANISYTHGQRARPAGAVGRDDAQHRRVRAQRRPEQRQPRRHLADVAGDAGVRRHADGQGGSRCSSAVRSAALDHERGARSPAAMRGVLVRLRKEAGLNQAALAARLRITQSQVSKYERGERVLDEARLRAWLGALGQPIEALDPFTAEPGRCRRRTELQVGRKGPMRDRDSWSSCGRKEPRAGGTRSEPVPRARHERHEDHVASGHDRQPSRATSRRRPRRSSGRCDCGEAHAGHQRGHRRLAACCEHHAAALANSASVRAPLRLLGEAVRGRR